MLAVRAVNQYRRRDVLAYIGLRYYLANRCAVRDRWGRDAATHVVLTRSSQPYFRTLHFKDFKDEATIEHRDIHIPGPNEAYAEAYLLQACAQAGVGLDFPAHVFSYRLAKDNTKVGMFEPYFRGFRSRHAAIVESCKREQDGLVLYTDIKRFYPSVSSELAHRVWQAECDRTGLAASARELGEKMLIDHAALKAPKCAGLLTGPMFSHLIGNLVLREVDKKMVDLLPNGYFRYVDDIIIVGTNQVVKDSRIRLDALLAELGLELHKTGKDFQVQSGEWLQGADDFKDDRQKPSWRTLIGSVKHLLVTKPKERDTLTRALAENGIRIPVPDYSESVRESNYLQSFTGLARQLWFKLKVGSITTGDLVRQALILRERHKTALLSFAKGTAEMVEYQRKRRITKLRYHASRLVYLASPDDLVELGRTLEPFPELRFHSEILNAVGKQDVSRLLSFGTNAVQSAAQPLRMNGRPVRCDIKEWSDVRRQGLAILQLNGIALADQQNIPLPDNELNQFARWDAGAPALMKSSDSFIREMACLHGCDSDRRHAALLDNAFDPDEELAFDAITQEKPSS